ncbi:hypothetical protein LRAMOSA06163 [Lichtheimia ramosa]|uniref:Uncharacterized protein n=1 Tax=Lichtheimia ramosa TaxID=688394 RepID=A0A077X4N7_9FUNG|nr:hypothetical protein LRAMOSA06163 [Lichtheimia ramosa]
MHAISTANPDNTLIVYTKLTKVSNCIAAAGRTMRECRVPQLPDTDVVISMIKERPGPVIGHVAYKEDLSYIRHATDLATRSLKRVSRTLTDNSDSQSTIRERQLRNDHTLGSNIDNIQNTSTSSSLPLINGMHPDRLAILSRSESNLSGTASSSDSSIDMSQSNIHNNQRERNFGPVIISSTNSNSDTCTTNIQMSSTSSSSPVINDMHPDHLAMLNRPESYLSNIASSSSSSHTDINVPEITIHPIPPSMTMSSTSSADTLQQPTAHNMMDQAMLSHQSATGENDSRVAVMPDTKMEKKRKRLEDKKERQDTTKAPKLAKPKSTSKRNQRLQQMEDMFQPAIDHGLDLNDEEESQQQPTTTTTPVNVSQQPVPQERRNQGWISWIRNIFF